MIDLASSMNFSVVIVTGTTGILHASGAFANSICHYLHTHSTLYLRQTTSQILNHLILLSHLLLLTLNHSILPRHFHLQRPQFRTKYLRPVALLLKHSRRLNIHRRRPPLPILLRTRQYQRRYLRIIPFHPRRHHPVATTLVKRLGALVFRREVPEELEEDETEAVYVGGGGVVFGRDLFGGGVAGGSYSRRVDVVVDVAGGKDYRVGL
mmetsp:Transcript_27204/g.49407  ORF Transcript_27204/g.49407 Transcript_27204/m.49407 type:complete len:209 (+) Transcript_27204:198-824(+)